MYLMASTRCGISAKQLERELGVTYKTAWRMFNQIRNELMNDDDERAADRARSRPTKPRGAARPRRKIDQVVRPLRSAKRKPTVLGMVERGGRVRAGNPVEAWRGALVEKCERNINPDSILYTDDWVAYKPLSRSVPGPPRHQPLGRLLRRR